MTETHTSFPLPAGFLCSGIISGIKEDKSKKDLGLIHTKKDALLGAVYTQNKFPSVHVGYCRNLTPSNRFRALIVNSGNANAATGQKGIQANLHLTVKLASLLGIEQNQVFTSSTGIIGRPFPIATIEASLGKLIENLQPDCTTVAEAIMTTDTKKKIAYETVRIGDKHYTVTGFAKGSGMIHPNMATMLAYILTDAPIPFAEIQSLTARVSEKSFNCVSVDGDTSTNDSFYLICSNPVAKLQQRELESVKHAVEKVAVALAKQIARDGEGARHLIEVTVCGGTSIETCRKVLRAILTSSLVKTAIYGKDPNWGRLLMAAGNGLAGSSFQNNAPLSIKIQEIPVLVAGEPVEFEEAVLSTAMDRETVRIELDLHGGTYSITGWSCDLTEEYIHINADYTT
jgi:glutamate N-acetyltransferase/amino-acid N-acetyltransferase